MLNTLGMKIFTKIEGGEDPLFAMEFYKEGVLTAVNFNKNGSEIGKQKFKNPLKTPCFFRVDTESVYETECFIGDDEELYAIGLVENINEDLLNQFKSGSKLRIKIAPYESQTEPLYLRFSLKGFSAAYKRALVLQNEDAKVFE